MKDYILLQKVDFKKVLRYDYCMNVVHGADHCLSEKFERLFRELHESGKWEVYFVATKAEAEMLLQAITETYTRLRDCRIESDIEAFRLLAGCLWSLMRDYETTPG